MIEASLNETAGLVTKASRAIDFSWGQAEEIGFAVRLLCEYQFPGVQLFVEHIQGFEQSSHPSPQISEALIWNSPDGATICPLIAGITYKDFSEIMINRGPVIIDPVASPILCVPFVLSTSIMLGVDIQVEFSGNRFVCVGESLYCRMTPGWKSATPSTVTVSVEASGRCQGDCRIREPSAVNVSDDNWHFLETLAMKTYVAGSDESRMMGAGAGLSDND